MLRAKGKIASYFIYSVKRMTFEKVRPNECCGKRKPHIADKKRKNLMSASVQDAAYIAIGTHQQHAIGENNVVIKFSQKMNALRKHIVIHQKIVSAEKKCPVSAGSSHSFIPGVINAPVRLGNIRNRSAMTFKDFQRAIC